MDIGRKEKWKQNYFFIITFLWQSNFALTGKKGKGKTITKLFCRKYFLMTKQFCLNMDMGRKEKWKQNHLIVSTFLWQSNLALTGK